MSMPEEADARLRSSTYWEIPPELQKFGRWIRAQPGYPSKNFSAGEAGMPALELTRALIFVEASPQVASTS